MRIFIGLKLCSIMLTGFDVSTSGLNCLYFPHTFMLPKSCEIRANSLPKHQSFQILSGLVAITPESRGASAHSTPCSEPVWLEPSTWLGSDKSGHKVALLPFLNCLQGLSPDLHVNCATTSLFGIPETVQNNLKRPGEKIKSVPRCIQNTRHSQILTVSCFKFSPNTVCIK